MSKLYVTYISNTYSLKNSLEKQVYELLTKNNRIAITPQNLDSFKKGLLEKIECLNNENKRCKPVKATWFGHKKQYGENRDDYSLSIPQGICYFYIYEMNLTK